MNNYPDNVSAGDPSAPWNQPDAEQLQCGECGEDSEDYPDAGDPCEDKECDGTYMEWSPPDPPCRCPGDNCYC